jgi:hypothetical protein
MELPVEAGLLDVAVDPEVPVEHPARASAAAIAVAERVRNFLGIIGIQVLQDISGRRGATVGMCIGDAPGSQTGVPGRGRAPVM